MNISQIDISLDETIKLFDRNVNITDHLIRNYTSDELHIMYRLLRQRNYKDNAHLLSLLQLARSIKGTLNQPYLKGFKA